MDIEDAKSASARAADRRFLGRLLRPLTSATVRAIGSTGDAAARALQASAAMLEHPDSVGGAAGDMARVAAQVTKDLAGIALMDNDAVTSLKGLPSGSKVVAWNEPLALDDVKAVGKALGCSVNDVLLASCVGGDPLVPRTARRRGRRHRAARDGAGEPARSPQVEGTRQQVRAGAAAAAGRHREPDLRASTRCGAAWTSSSRATRPY